MSVSQQGKPCGGAIIRLEQKSAGRSGRGKKRLICALRAGKARGPAAELSALTGKLAGGGEKLPNVKYFF